MPTVRALLALLILLPAAVAQQPNPAAGQAQTKPHELCTLEGVVVKSSTGEPTRKVQVTLSRIGDMGQQPITETDSNGRFVFANLEPGRYTVHAGGSGYPYQSYGHRSPGGRGELIGLEPGEHKRDIVFRLEPGSVITGTVYDEDGNPVVLAQVQAFRVSTRGGALRHSGSSGGQTNDLGEYRLFGLEPGRYLIVATEPGRPLPNRPTDLVYVPTFYPGTADPGQASSVQVNPGDEASSIDLTLSQSRSMHVRGRVVMGGPGKPADSLYVSLAPRSATFAGLPLAQYGASVQDDKGSFDIPGVPSGSYLLMANWNGQDRNYLGRIPLEVGSADADGIVLTLNPGIELRGRIRADPGLPVDFTKLGLWLQSTDSPNWGGVTSQVKGDGTFVIENVFDGNYRLHVGGFPEESYLKSARLGGADVLIPGLSISHDTSPGTLDLQLALDGGRVDGTVLHNQNPSPGALVVLVPDLPNRDRDELYSSKPADELGRFSLLGLPPGDFKLFAWESGQGLDFKDPEFLKNYEDRGRRVHIETNQQQNVQLELIPAEEESQ